MEPNAPSYIERAADDQLLVSLMAGEYVFLLDSRQKGKSSLVARTIIKLKEHGAHTVKLDLQRIGANVTPEQWYAGLLTGIGQELGLTEDLFEYWGSHQAIGPLARWVGALESVMLPKTERPIAIFIDEIDFVRALPFSTDEFFAGIRDCHNRRSEVQGFERFDLLPGRRRDRGPVDSKPGDHALQPRNKDRTVRFHASRNGALCEDPRRAGSKRRGADAAGAPLGERPSLSHAAPLQQYRRQCWNRLRARR